MNSVRAGLITTALCLIAPTIAWSEAWLQQGWQAVAAGKYNSAMRSWQQGVNTLPGKRLLPSLGVYRYLPNALQQLKKIGPRFDAFLLRHNRRGRQLYFVVSLRELPLVRSQRKLAMADLKQAAGITGLLLGIEAGNFRLEPVPDNLITQPLPAATLQKKMLRSELKRETGGSDDSVGEPRLLINRFRIVGNQRVSTDLIIMSLRDFYGSGKTADDLKLIQKRVQSLYHDAGIRSATVEKPIPIDEESVQITIHESGSMPTP